MSRVGGSRLSDLADKPARDLATKSIEVVQRRGGRCVQPSDIDPVVVDRDHVADVYGSLELDDSHRRDDLVFGELLARSRRW